MIASQYETSIYTGVEQSCLLLPAVPHAGSECQGPVSRNAEAWDAAVRLSALLCDEIITSDHRHKIACICTSCENGIPLQRCINVPARSKHDFVQPRCRWLQSQAQGRS